MIGLAGRLVVRLAAGIAALAGLLALLAAAYLLAAWIGSALPRNPDFVESPTGVGILVETNGAHTAIVVPVANGQKDWRAVFPEATGPRPGDGRLPTHLSISWGEREVFLTVPTLRELGLGMALRIAFKGGDALLRVSPLVDPRTGPDRRALTISPAQYTRLARRIEASLVRGASEGPHNLRATYSDDAFYPVHGRYTLFYTCNNWVADMLADAGIRIGRWTPLAGGVMRWFPHQSPDGPDALALAFTPPRPGQGPPPQPSIPPARLALGPERWGLSGGSEIGPTSWSGDASRQAPRAPPRPQKEPALHKDPPPPARQSPTSWR